MTEITVTVPLSFFGEQGISPEGIKKLADVEADKARLEQKNADLVAQMVQFAQQLGTAIDADMNMMDKFRYLRQLASETAQFANFINTGKA